jgi:hypothetical protein
VNLHSTDIGLDIEKSISDLPSLANHNATSRVQWQTVRRALLFGAIAPACVVTGVSEYQVWLTFLSTSSLLLLASSPLSASRGRDNPTTAMPAPSGHGQRNKKHNHGKHASKNTRAKHKVAGDDAPHRRTIKVRRRSLDVPRRRRHIARLAPSLSRVPASPRRTHPESLHRN